MTAFSDTLHPRMLTMCERVNFCVTVFHLQNWALDFFKSRLKVMRRSPHFLRIREKKNELVPHWHTQSIFPQNPAASAARPDGWRISQMTGLDNGIVLEAQQKDYNILGKHSVAWWRVAWFPGPPQRFWAHKWAVSKAGSYEGALASPQNLGPHPRPA